MQFRFLSQAEAREYLATTNQTSENIGDRIAAARRVDYVTTAEERAAAHEFNLRHGRPLKPWT